MPCDHFGSRSVGTRSDKRDVKKKKKGSIRGIKDNSLTFDSMWFNKKKEKKKKEKNAGANK